VEQKTPTHGDTGRNREAGESVSVRGLRLMKKRILGFLILIALVLSGCGSSTNHATPAAGGISVTDMVTSIGGVNNDTSQQVISFKITLISAEPAAVTIHSIKFTLANEFDKRILSGDRQVTVEKSIEPNATIEINGELKFDASGVSKDQISGWGTPITGITALTEQTVFIQSQGTK